MTREKKINQMSIANCDLDEIEIVLGNKFELVNREGKYYAVKKKPQYPKTYEECCDVLKIPNDERYIDIDVPLDYNKLLSAFTKLLIYRKAYWKIAGEQLGLDKPWEYDMSKNEFVYAITYQYGEIQKCEVRYKNCILVFPTAEMRDTFYENFKELIESIKKLL